jgi:hypothetical protein
VRVLLDALWSNLPLRLALLRIRTNSVRFFGLNSVGQNQFDECFDQWYTGLTDKLVGP